MHLFEFFGNKHESQRIWVKRQLEKHGKISRNQCLRRWPSITRLAVIIFRLKKSGMVISAKEVGNDYVYYHKGAE